MRGVDAEGFLDQLPGPGRYTGVIEFHEDDTFTITFDGERVDLVWPIPFPRPVESQKRLGSGDRVVFVVQPGQFPGMGDLEIDIQKADDDD